MEKFASIKVEKGKEKVENLLKNFRGKFVNLQIMTEVEENACFYVLKKISFPEKVYNFTISFTFPDIILLKFQENPIEILIP